MSSKLNIDELNIITYTDAEVENWLNEYFSPMELPEEQINKRKDAARDFRDVLLFILLAIKVADEIGKVDWDRMRFQLELEFGSVARQYARDDDYMKDFVRKAAEDFIDVTRERTEKDGMDSRWTSDERALPDAANYANMTVGYEEWQEAIDAGKAKKMWVSQRDGKVRHTHRLADGQTVPIKAYFAVGNSRLLYPTDPDGEPEEIVNCRCHLKYV